MTIKVDVLNRFTGDVQFTAEIDCEESESIEIKLGLAVRWAFNNRANLNGAKLWGVRGNNNQIKSIHITAYDISFTESVVQIGCENHSKEAWLAFSDDEINGMGSGALAWWKEWKPKLQAIGVFGEV